MVYTRFLLGGVPSWGQVEGDSVREIAGTPFAGGRQTGRSLPLTGARLLAPAVPSRVLALAWNYADHLKGREEPKDPQVFLKLPSCLIAPGEPIVLPPGAGRVDEEAELVAVIGRPCQNVSPREAAECIFGYTCGNDVSARVWQKNDLTWWRAKASDTFAPLGPFLVTGLAPADLTVIGRVNGREVQRCSPRDMFFDVPTLVSWISRSIALDAGDLVYTGTSGSPAELADGDVVEVEIGGIGVLRNPVRAGS
ncbi:MAG: fumarylacetoacetate hydrolase family protein [Spirochaetes bacterium]|nr:fumarylacetoacetate hydrolase family protein [Spirochaetota bacterium]